MKDQIAAADEALLAELGYKQEFLRAFTPLEVSSVGLFRPIDRLKLDGYRYLGSRSVLLVFCLLSRDR